MMPAAPFQENYWTGFSDSSSSSGTTQSLTVVLLKTNTLMKPEINIRNHSGEYKKKYTAKSKGLKRNFTLLAA